MQVTPAELEQQMRRKSVSELRAIIDSSPEHSTAEARVAASAALAKKTAAAGESGLETEEAPVQSGSRQSLLSKILAVIVALAVIRQLLRVLSHLIFR